MNLPKVTSLESWTPWGEPLNEHVRIRFENGAIIKIIPSSDEFSSHAYPRWPSGARTDEITFDGLSVRSTAFEVLSAIISAREGTDDLTDYPELKGILTA